MVGIPLTLVLVSAAVERESLNQICIDISARCCDVGELHWHLLYCIFIIMRRSYVTRNLVTWRFKFTTWPPVSTVQYSRFTPNHHHIHCCDFILCGKEKR